MTFEDFWRKLKDQGRTPEGDEFSVHLGGECELLHIISDFNNNKKYRIRKETAEKYFQILNSREMTPKEFRYRKSAYFENIFRFLSK